MDPNLDLAAKILTPILFYRKTDGNKVKICTEDGQVMNGYTLKAQEGIITEPIPGEKEWVLLKSNTGYLIVERNSAGHITVTEN